MKDKLQVCHPNLWKFLDHLSGYSKLQHIIIEQLSRGMQVTRSVKTKYILNSKRIKIASDQLELGILTRNEFLVKCSHTVDGYILREGNWNRNVNDEFLSSDDDDIAPLPLQQINEPNIVLFEEPEVLDIGPVVDVPIAEVLEENLDEQELEIEDDSIVEHVNIVNAPNQDNSEDENDFIVPEDLELRIWENIYGPFEEAEETPFVQVPENIEQYRVTPNENLCIICFESLATHAPVPCGHKVMCENCASQLDRQRCPLCNTDFLLIIRIY